MIDENVEVEDVEDAAVRIFLPPMCVESIFFLEVS